MPSQSGPGELKTTHRMIARPFLTLSPKMGALNSLRRKGKALLSPKTPKRESQKGKTVQFEEGDRLKEYIKPQTNPKSRLSGPLRKCEGIKSNSRRLNKNEIRNYKKLMQKQADMRSKIHFVKENGESTIEIDELSQRNKKRNTNIRSDFKLFSFPK